MSSRVSLLAACALFFAASVARGGGPRFITGTTYPTPGAPMAFFTSQVSYFTDPGELNANIPHATADSIVAAAAAAWNVPTSSLTLRQGGELAEHVSSENTYFDGTNVVFPADASAADYATNPIAVIYDEDGSVTDLLLGEGASDPSSCRQNEVTPVNDGFGATGTIEHALIVINGRCVGSTTNDFLQLQYEVMRAFGRVIGIAWSQTNDNVFTGTSQPTAVQMSYWPVMHPIDVICGTYTYLCMTNPFTLRPDDLDSLAWLYPVTASNIVSGETLTATNATTTWGYIWFPNQMGMNMVNVTTEETLASNPAEPWEVVSGVTGVESEQNVGNPVTGPEPAEDNVGTATLFYASYFGMPRIAAPQGYAMTFVFEAIDPLYTGSYALGPFQRPPLAPSGTLAADRTSIQDTSNNRSISLTVSNAANSCSSATLGSQGSPTPVSSTGWWTNVLCAGDDWGSVAIKAGRTWTLETTALDENGGETVQKAQPVLGVWNSTDPVNTLPTVASQPVPLNGVVPGMTQLNVEAAGGNATYRFVVADEYGALRPDFALQGRVLYADNVVPATVGAQGGQITINGMGFANGNEVLVNGVAAKVTSWGQNQIVATAPTEAAAKATGGTAVDVEVVDLTTGGTTDIGDALTYPGGAAQEMVKVSAPSSLQTGTVASTPFAVKVLASDGVTPVAGASVQFAVTTGAASMGSCGAASLCTLTTNSSGVAQTTVAGVTAGAVALTATDPNGGATVQVSMTDTNPSETATITTPTAYVGAGATVSLPVTLNAVENGTAAANVPVVWSVSQGLALSGASSATGANGAATISVLDNGMAAGTASVEGCVWTTVCASWSVVSVAASQWTPVVVSGAGQSVSASGALAPVVVEVTDAAGHPLVGAAVSVAQTVDSYEGPCPAHGRCPAAAVLATSQSSAVTGANGMVTIVPLTVPSVGQVVNIAVSTGTVGFVALSLVMTP